MDIDQQTDFLLAAFDVWWHLELRPALAAGRASDPGLRALALAAFSAGILATDSLLVQMNEEQGVE